MLENRTEEVPRLSAGQTVTSSVMLPADHIGDCAGAARAYAARGWPVFPVQTRDKRPLTAHGFKDATTDPRAISSWWRRWPSANVGVATGAASGILVLDVDAPNGDESLEGLEGDHGPLPRTPRAMTGGGGSHFLFRMPATGVRSSIGGWPGIDVKADGGYIVAPPSTHPNGRRYCWDVDAHPDDVPLAEAPTWLVALRQQSAGKPAARSTVGWRSLLEDGVGKGSRNATITSIAGHLYRRYVDPELVYQLVTALNALLFRPPLDRFELEGILARVAKLEAARRERQGGNHV